MITTRLSGGLGNQMFQYAAGRALALSRSTDLALDLSWFQRATQKQVRTKRSYELGVFHLGSGVSTFGNERRAPWQRSTELGDPPLLRKEATFRFDDSLSSAADGTVLDGYWQSERYFDSFADVIRGDFQFRATPSRRTRELLDRIAGTEAISLHVRRGDYVSDPHTAAFHGTVTTEHYLTAVDRIARSVAGDARVFVFSDDIGWCRSALQLQVPTTFVDHNHGRRSFEDLWLMSTCRHHILANSSFSWWGAWLAEHPTQEVIAPNRWFSDASIDTADLVPARWQKLLSVR